MSEATAAMTSTPIASDTELAALRAIRTAKRPRAALGSDNSAEAELSYLDLSTGNINTVKPKQMDPLAMNVTDFDSILSKLELFEKGFKKLDKLDKLDRIETNIDKLMNQVEQFEDRLSINENVTSELKASVAFISDQYDDLITQSTSDKNKLSECSDGINAIKSENDDLRSAIINLQEINKSLKEDLVDLKCRSMRDNLVFTNIPEYPQNVDGRRFEDTEAVLLNFLHDKLELDNVKFERVHKTMDRGKARDSGPRPIVAKFSLFKGREIVRKSGYKLKGTNYGIHEQFPEEVEQKRRELYPVMRQCRWENKQAVLVKDKLYVNGEFVRPEEAARMRANLPKKMKDSRS